jgi:hypothetical protein
MAYVEGVWQTLASLGKVSPPDARDNRFKFEVDYSKAGKACPGAAAWRSYEMWCKDVSMANKKGWGWSGDTVVTVYKFTAPSLREVSPCHTCWLSTLMLGARLYFLPS